jgi:tetratricopeptide (TPR) repeat protein
MADNQRIDDLRRRVQKDPASIAFAQLAEELRRNGQFEESIETCRTGLARHPGYLSARVTLGRALIELNQLEEAQGELEQVLKNAPENLAALRGLGEIHHRRGELAEALAQYRAALALARNDPDLEETVAELSRQVEPAQPAAVDDALSLDQMQSELLKLAPPQPASEPPPVWEAPAILEVPPEPESVRASEAPLESEAPPEPEAPPAWAPDTFETLPVAFLEVSGVSDTLNGAVEPEVAPAMHEPVPSEAELEHTARTLAALEQWLDAIHVARADRHA